MIKPTLLWLISAACLFAAPTRIALIGDSITAGAGAQILSKNSYAARLAELLGKNYEVKPFAKSSLCMLQSADLPYVKTPLMQKVLEFKPDIAVVLLGTNDTCQNERRKNWQHHNDLQKDATDLIARLRKANPETRVLLCSPLAMFPNQPKLKAERKADLTERSKRLPLIHRAYARVAALDSDVDFHDLTRAISNNATTDGVHPHTVAHQQLAHHLRELIIQPTDKPADLSRLGRKVSTWHGFEKHDFVLPKSKAKAILVKPHTVAKDRPWIWRARFFGHQPELDLSLLDRGYHLAYVDVSNLYGSSEAIQRGEELHTLLTQQCGLKPKAILEGMSRGGLFIFNYAAAHPKHVSAIYGDNPVCNFNSWPGGKNGKLSTRDWKNCLKAYGITEKQAPKHPQITDPSFAKRIKGIPVACVVGTMDKVVPASENAEPVIKHLSKINSPHKIWRKPGLGHHPHGLSPASPLMRFLLRADGRPNNPATLPTPSSTTSPAAGWGTHWWAARDHIKKQAKANPDCDVVFLGDSITQGLTGHRQRTTRANGKRAIDIHLAKQLDKKAISLGFSGARTEHILWLLNDGWLDGLKPRHIVLMIGVNNINARSHTGEEIAEGTRQIVKWLRKNKPNSKILLLGCFPTKNPAAHPARYEVETLHRLIRPLADNKRIYYQDLRPLFLKPDGSTNPKLMRGDAIHINYHGQEAWIKAIAPHLKK